MMDDWMAGEVLSRPSLPAWLKTAVRRREGAACASVSPRLPVLRLHEAGGRVVDDLIVLPASAFAAWFGGWRGEGGAE